MKRDGFFPIHKSPSGSGWLFAPSCDASGLISVFVKYNPNRHRMTRSMLNFVMLISRRPIYLGTGSLVVFGRSVSGTGRTQITFPTWWDLGLIPNRFRTTIYPERSPNIWNTKRPIMVPVRARRWTPSFMSIFYQSAICGLWIQFRIITMTWSSKAGAPSRWFSCLMGPFWPRVGQHQNFSVAVMDRSLPSGTEATAGLI